jgi:hypothetical protein
MVDILRLDSSLERHLAARLNQWAGLDEDESLLVEQAYGSFGASEHMLPASVSVELKSWLCSTATACCAGSLAVNLD